MRKKAAARVKKNTQGDSQHHSDKRTNRRAASETIGQTETFQGSRKPSVSGFNPETRRQHNKQLPARRSNTNNLQQPPDKKSGSSLHQTNNNLPIDTKSSQKSTIKTRVEQTGKQAVSKSKLTDSILSTLSVADSNHKNWIVQVSPETINIWQNEFLAKINEKCRVKSLGRDFYFLALECEISSQELLKTIFPRWICPIELQWPVSPHSAHFVEKAARGITKKFGQSWTSLQVLSSTPELKNIATGLKGRLIQLQNSEISGIKSSFENFPLSIPQSSPEVPDESPREVGEVANSNCLAVLVHPQGLLAGERTSPLGFGSVFPGGLGFLYTAETEGIRTKKLLDDESELNQTPQQLNQQFQSATSTVSTTTLLPPSAPVQDLYPKSVRTSRAGGKISEVILLLSSCLNITSDVYYRWLELGAAPGGMTEELVNWGAKVTAVDLASLAHHIEVHPNVTYLKEHAQNISSAREFDGILCDMNGPAENSAHIMCKLIPTLNPGSLIVHTLKLKDLRSALEQITSMKTQFQKCGCHILFIKHLFHNRKEVTFVMIRSAAIGKST